MGILVISALWNIYYGGAVEQDWGECYTALWLSKSRTKNSLKFPRRINSSQTPRLIKSKQKTKLKWTELNWHTNNRSKI